MKRSFHLLALGSWLLGLGLCLISLSEAKSQFNTPTGSMICDPPAMKKMDFSTSNFQSISGYDVVGCYAPVYSWSESPTVYYSPGSSIGSPPPAIAPGSTDGSETVFVPQFDSEARSLKGCYVWFEFGEWGFNSYTLTYHWAGIGGCCSWCWIVNPGGSCFSAGSHLLTAEGSMPIERLKVGDSIVVSPRNKTGATPVSQRIREIVSSRAQLLELVVGGKTISTTREHPIYAKEKGWIAARSLAVGDCLRSHKEDSWIQVESTKNGLEANVYNVLVDGKSGYFVGRSDWGFSMWASDGCCDLESPSSVQTAHCKTFDLLSRAAENGKLIMLKMGQ